MKSTVRINWPLSITASLAATVSLFLLVNAHAIIPFLIVAALFWWLGARQVGRRYAHGIVAKVHSFFRRFE